MIQLKDFRVFLFLQIFTGLLFDRVVAQGFTTIEKLEASVNKEIVLKSDIEDFRRTMPLRAQLDSMFQSSPLARAGEGAKDKDIKAYLIQDRLVRSRFQVSKDELSQEIDSIKKNNNMSQEQLVAMLKSQGYSFRDYESLMTSSIAMRNLISREIAPKVSVSDAEAKSFFLNKDPLGKAKPKSYQISLISNQSEETLKLAKQKINSGTPFSEVAKKFSEDASRDRGGSLGQLSESQINPIMRSTLATMQPGDVSSIIKASPRLFLILKLEGVKSEADQAFEEKKEEIKAKLAQDEYRHQIELWIERQKGEAHIHDSDPS